MDVVLLDPDRRLCQQREIGSAGVKGNRKEYLFRVERKESLQAFELLVVSVRVFFEDVSIMTRNYLLFDIIS